MKQYATTGKLKPQEVNGFKSKLESYAASWLTEAIDLKALYEPQTFNTALGNYTPDFYCPEINTYFECKPSYEFANWSLYKQFCKDQKVDFVLVTPLGIYVMEYENGFCPETVVPEKDEVPCVIICSECGKKSFTSESGYYKCRVCDFHNGDHDRYDANQYNKKIGYITFKQYYDYKSYTKF